MQVVESRFSTQIEGGLVLIPNCLLSMSLIHWQSLQALEAIHHQIQSDLMRLIESSHGSTVWVSTNGTDLISEIKIHETETDVILDIRLPKEITDLEVQLSSETALLRARSQQDEVEGFFSSGQLQNIIPLPISVHPEAVHAEFQDSILTLKLPRSGRIDRHRIAVQFSHNQPSNLLHESVTNF